MEDIKGLLIDLDGVIYNDSDSLPEQRRVSVGYGIKISHFALLRIQR